MAEILNIGLEPGDKSEIGSEVTSGSSTLTVTTGAAQADTGFGYLSTHDGSNVCYGKNTLTAFTSTDHRFRVYFDVSSLGIADTSNATIVNLVTADPYSVTSLRITYDSPSTWAIYGITVNNANGLEITGEHTIDESIPHWAEVHVHRASGTGGYIKVYLDGDPTEVASKTSFANDSARQPATCRFGVTSNSATGTSELDELVLRDDSTEIGAYTGQPEGMITHEAADNSEYDDTASITGDTSFNAASSGLATTSYGQKFTFTGGTTSSWAAKNVVFPVDSVYRVRLYFDTTNLTMTNNDKFNWAMTRTSVPATQLTIGIIQTSGTKYLNCYADGPGYVAGSTAITAGEHYVEMLVDMAAGTIDYYLDGSASADIEHTGGPNNAIGILLVGLSGPDAGTSGSTVVDEIAWRPYNVEIGAWDANIVDKDYETGSVEGGTVTEALGGTVAINPAASMNSSNFGLEASPNTTSGSKAYVRHALPGADTGIVRARCYFNKNDVTNADTENFTGPLAMRDSAAALVCGLILRETSGVIQCFGVYETNTGQATTGTLETITSGDHWIEFEYKWDASAGYFKWWLDGVLVEEDATLATSTVNQVEQLDVGVTSCDAGAGGSLYVDEVIVRNSSTPIGTDGAGAGFAAAAVTLSMTLVASTATPNVGDNMTLTATCSNAGGASDATTVVGEVNLPSGLQYVSDDGEGSYDDSTGVWTIGSITNGTSADALEVTCKVLGTGTYAAYAEVDSCDQTDTVSTFNDQAGDDYAATTPTPNARIDLRLTATSSDYNPGSGVNFTVTYTVFNAADYSTATNVKVSIPIPANATWQSDTPNEYDQTTTKLWSVTNIAGGASETIDIVWQMSDTVTTNFDAEVSEATETDSTSTWSDNQGEDWARVTINGEGGSPLRFFFGGFK